MSRGLVDARARSREMGESGGLFRRGAKECTGGASLVVPKLNCYYCKSATTATCCKGTR